MYFRFCMDVESMASSVEMENNNNMIIKLPQNLQIGIIFHIYMDKL